MNHHILPKTFQHIQNSLARAVVRAPKSSHINPALKSLHWLKIKQRIDYKIISLTDLGMFSMFGRTGAPQKGAPTRDRQIFA